MRNLKKVLSLTLALVMMLGMMTFAGAAETKMTSADLKDMDKVVNKEAVSLLVDLGIINGIKAADGTYSFNPAANIERGAYAKMVYAVMMASDNADVYKGVNTGLKDVAGHWAEGFIGYCVTTKLAAGNGNGTFTPNANITTVAASKMLLVALGYDAKASGYEGDDLWSINIMRDAQKAGLLNGVNQKATESLTRDNAARLIYNALFANTVVADYQYDMGVKHLTKYTANATTLGLETCGLVKVTGAVGAITNGKIDYTGTVTVVPTVASMFGHNAVVAGDASMIGQTVATYHRIAYKMVSNVLTWDSYKNSLPTTNSSNRVVLTDTEGTSTGKLVADKKITLDDTTVKYSMNGSAPFTGYICTADGHKNEITTKSDASWVDPTAAKWTEPVVGAVVEYIDNTGDGKVDAVIQTRYQFSQVTKKITKAGAESLTIKFDGSTATIALDNIVSGFADVEKDDYINVLKLAGTTPTYKIVKAEMVTGIMTSFKSTGTAVISGKTYTISALTRADKAAGGANNAYTAAVSDTDAEYFLDPNGYVVATNAIDGEKTYLVIMQGAESATGILTDKTYSVLTVDTDGLTKTYPIKSSIATVGALKDVWSKLTGTASAIVPQLVEATINKDGKITACANVKPASTSYTLSKNNAVIASSDVMTSKTKFVFATFNDDYTAVKTTVVTGLANVPAGTYAKGAYIADTGVVEVVYAYNKATVSASSDYAYLESTDFSQSKISGTTYNTYDFAVNGVAVPMTIAAADAGVIAAGTVYSFTTDKDGITTLTPAGSTAGAVLAAADDTYVKVGSSVIYLKADYKVTDVTGSGVSETTLAKGQTVTYVTELNTANSRQEIVAVFVTGDVNAAAPTAVTIEGATNKGLTVASGDKSVIGQIGKATAFVDGSADCVKITVTAASGTTVTSVKFNGTEVATSATPKDDLDTGAAAGLHVLSVTVKDSTTLKTTTYNYFFTVRAGA